MSMMDMAVPTEHSSVVDGSVRREQLSLIDGGGANPRKPFDRRELVENTIRKLLGRRNAVAHDLSQLDARIEYLYYDLCSSKDKPQHVELYDGTLGVSRSFVSKHQKPVGQLQWLDLSERFKDSGDDAGNVSGQRWGTGSLIDDDLFLTAGHCFGQKYPAFQVPRRNNAPISPEEIAKLMCVNFNFQIDGVTKKLRESTSYPVVELLEMSQNGVDYAIVRLGTDKEGKLPGAVFGKLTIAKNDPTVRNAILCIIEHAGRKEKKVEAGHLLDIRDGRMAYNDIGTSGGSSGSPILDEKGEIVGVHTKGGSLPIGGFNSGTTVGAIRSVSKVIAALKPSPLPRAVLSQVPPVESTTAIES